MLKTECFTSIQSAFPKLRLAAEPLSQHTSFRIGGVSAIAFPSSLEELTQLYRFCLSESIPTLLLGAGTNILAPDEGVEQLVISTRELNAAEALDETRLQAQCGLSLTRLAVFAREHSLTGLEFAHGIPGTVGGGVYMNAGAYGGELSQRVTSVTALLPDGKLWQVSGQELDFSYRSSVFQNRQALILSAVFQLEPGNRDAISHTMTELAEKRRSSQPLEFPSAGSTFKRPASGYAAALIDQAGLKGRAVGGAEVSRKHAGFVINRGGATAADVLALMETIKQEVYASSGIRLEPEVRIW